MTAPEQALVAWLERPRSRVRQPRSDAGSVSFGPPAFEADVASLRIEKERATEHRRLYAISFRETSGARWNWILPVEPQLDGTWRVVGGCGAGGARPVLGAYLSVRALAWSPADGRGLLG